MLYKYTTYVIKWRRQARWLPRLALDTPLPYFSRSRHNGASMTALALAINGMSCSHCLNAVRRALSDTPGVAVESVRIGRADVQYDPALTTPEKSAAAVTDAGYEAAYAR